MDSDVSTTPSLFSSLYGVLDDLVCDISQEGREHQSRRIRALLSALERVVIDHHAVRFTQVGQGCPICVEAGVFPRGLGAAPNEGSGKPDGTDAALSFPRATGRPVGRAEEMRQWLGLEQHMLELKDSGDQEAAHAEADEILCEALQLLGAHQLVSFYARVPRWYA